MTTADMAELYSYGWSYGRIARRAGLTPSAVRSRLNRAGVAGRRDPGRPRASLPGAAELAERRARGATLAELAAECGVCIGTIWNRLKAARAG